MIDKLKALEAAATPGPWPTVASDDPDQWYANIAFIDAIRNLAPELIALWEIDNFWLKEREKFNLSVVADIQIARKGVLKALNAKAKEIL